MADKSTQLILDGLARAAADPGGVPLHGTKGTPGLFGSSLSAKQAAQRCIADGWLCRLELNTNGQSAKDRYALTEKGLAFVLSRVSPAQMLEEFVGSLAARQAEIAELVATATRWHASFEVFRTRAEKILEQICSTGQNGTTSHLPNAPSANGTDTWVSAVVPYLRERQNSNAAGDCPLPELYRQARDLSPHLTIGHFHDALRSLHENERIYLHPWTGPLHELPEPILALLVGHEVAYYASPRS